MISPTVLSFKVNTLGQHLFFEAGDGAFIPPHLDAGVDLRFGHQRFFNGMHINAHEQKQFSAYVGDDHQYRIGNPHEPIQDGGRDHADPFIKMFGIDLGGDFSEDENGNGQNGGHVNDAPFPPEGDGQGRGNGAHGYIDQVVAQKNGADEFFGMFQDF